MTSHDDHDHHHDHDHGHTHEHASHPGRFQERPKPLARRDVARRAFTVGVGGPVGSGKTALVLALCRKLRDERSLAVITNDIFTREDAEFLIRNQALPSDRINAVETGGCPHAAIREDISANLVALEELNDRFHPEILLLESGGDNLAADFSRELADYTIYVIDVAGGDKIPRKGGPGITQSDLLVINKTDLAPAVGADLVTMDRDSRRMRAQDRSFLRRSSTARESMPSRNTSCRRGATSRRTRQRRPRPAADGSSCRVATIDRGTQDS